MYSMAKRRTGKVAGFTAAQNKALRATLKEIAQQYASQKELGMALGVRQQNAGRLLNDSRAGFGYTTALAVARLAGFGGVEALFAAKGLAPESSPVLEDTSLHARAG